MYIQPFTQSFFGVDRFRLMILGGLGSRLRYLRFLIFFMKTPIRFGVVGGVCFGIFFESGYGFIHTSSSRLNQSIKWSCLH